MSRLTGHLQLKAYGPIPLCLGTILSLTLSYGNSIALRPERDYKAVPSDYGIVYEAVGFETSDGLTIHGWYFPAQDTVSTANRFVGRVIPMPEGLKQTPGTYLPDYDDPVPTVIICDGDAGNMTSLIFYAYHFCTNGLNVLTFDWRGFGHSEDWAIKADYLVHSEFLLDYMAAVDFVMGRRETDADRVGLFGFSTGAYMSFAVAARRGDISALACRALLTSFDDVLPILAKVSPSRTLQVPDDFPIQLLPARAAHDLEVPTLLVVGENDERTPPWMSRHVYENLPGEKELWIVPGASHGGANAPEYVAYPEFFERVSSFLLEHLRQRQ